KYMGMEAQMYSNLVEMAKPVTKMSIMVKDRSSLLRTVRRAIKVASTPPMGPVYVCLPADILDEEITEEVVPTSFPSTRVVPDDETIKLIASDLAKAEKPMIFMGDGIAYSEAEDELAEVAAEIGAEVWGCDCGELNIKYEDPLFMGQTGHMFGENSKPIMEKGDVNLICGTYVLPEVFPNLETQLFSEGAKVYHVDLNDYQIAQNHPVDLGVVADPKLTLRKIADELKIIMTADQKESAQARVADITKVNEVNLAKQIEADDAKIGTTPLHQAEFMRELANQLPDDAMIFDEALTSSPELTRYIQPSEKGHYFQTRGGSLGVGFPGAIGLKLANPDKTVVGFSGDGGSMYTIQALWTAAHHKVSAKMVVCNNHSYKLLKLNVMQYWKELGLPDHDFPNPFELTDPNIEFVQLAEAMGVPGIKVEKSEDIKPAIEKMLATDGPFLIDLVIDSEVPGHRVECKCGQ
ncbi:MAG: thiamine pyrophosphate-binding protein, partial [Proteobacteria bacterium]|nr:thiamine pyrophosphate-binding protein [Pseudomonadota bacterium]